jgi:hypothetical protein
MAEAGYGPDEIAAAERMLRKEGIKRDPEVQTLEDVVCFVFIRHYLGGFAEARDADELLKIVEKTARKMSAEGRARARRDFALPEPFAAAFRD